jgi:hypothetical protein
VAHLATVVALDTAPVLGLRTVLPHVALAITVAAD